MSGLQQHRGSRVGLPPRGNLPRRLACVLLGGVLRVHTQALPTAGPTTGATAGASDAGTSGSAPTNEETH